MIFYIYNIGVDLYNGFNGLRHRINWTYFTVLDGLAHPLYSDTNQQTQDFYDLLCKKVDKVGILHTESTTPPITKIHTIHCSEPLNP